MRVTFPRSSTISRDSFNKSLTRARRYADSSPKKTTPFRYTTVAPSIFLVVALRAMRTSRRHARERGRDCVDKRETNDPQRMLLEADLQDSNARRNGIRNHKR